MIRSALFPASVDVGDPTMANNKIQRALELTLFANRNSAWDSVKVYQQTRKRQWSNDGPAMTSNVFSTSVNISDPMMAQWSDPMVSPLKVTLLINRSSIKVCQKSKNMPVIQQWPSDDIQRFFYVG